MSYATPSADAHDLSVPAPGLFYRLGWQTRAALLPGALAGKDYHEAWIDLLDSTTHRNVRLMANPPQTRQR